MKPLTLLAASIAIPIGIASAQTPPAGTTTPTGTAPYIPLFSSGAAGSTGSNGAASPGSTWYIDTTRNLIVLCSQAAGGTSDASAPAFTCTAQAVPTAASTPAPGAPAPGAPAPGTPAPGAGTTGSGTPGAGASGGGTETAGSGGAGSNPYGG